ncbi:MAG: DUF6512 family protein [Oscillospiraceae bacterium]|nr:DUF6512 family protein [Oscillospiraceae bacterium]
MQGKNSTRLVPAFLMSSVVGCGLHFLFGLLPCPVTALFSPINESIWEHVKLIYWPYLAAMLWVTERQGRGCRGGWLFSLLIISIAMLAVGYVFHISLGGDRRMFDIGLYIVLLAAGFWLPGRLEGASAHRAGLVILTLGLGGAIVLFTFLPPDHILFADLSTVHTWYTIPY